MSRFYSSKIMGRYPTNLPWNYIKQVNHLKRSMSISDLKSLTIVDIGCGAGEASNLVLQQFPTSTVIGIDISVESLRAAQTFPVQVVAGSADGEFIPIQTGSIDIVFANEILEHLVHTDEFVQEIKRVLKPSGFLCISTPNLGAWFNRLALLVGLQPAFSEVSMRSVYGRPGSEVSGHLRLFTSRALSQFLESNGFKTVFRSSINFDSLPRHLKAIDKFASQFNSLGAIHVLVCRLN